MSKAGKIYILCKKYYAKMYSQWWIKRTYVRQKKGKKETKIADINFHRFYLFSCSSFLVYILIYFSNKRYVIIIMIIIPVTIQKIDGCVCSQLCSFINNNNVFLLYWYFPSLSLSLFLSLIINYSRDYIINNVVALSSPSSFCIYP